MKDVLGMDAIIGLTVEQAEKRLLSFGCTIRVVSVDGVGGAMTADFDPSRIDVCVRGGIIVSFK
jgi:hypothetical protein